MIENGFYVCQFNDGTIKIETVTYLNGHTVLPITIKLEFITSSIAAFLNANRDTMDVEVLVKRLLNGIDLTRFTSDEYTNVKNQLMGLLIDYLYR